RPRSRSTDRMESRYRGALHGRAGGPHAPRGAGAGRGVPRVHRLRTLNAGADSRPQSVARARVALAARDVDHPRPEGVSVKIFSFATVVALLAVATVLVSPAGAVLSAPVALSPSEGAVIESVPPFEWSAVSGAARYEWEISADAGFNSPVLGLGLDHFFTRNTWATLTKTIPDGTYWWHVRAVEADGDVGPWSASRSFVKQWAEQRFQPELLAPSNGSDVAYPTDVYRLAWTAVPGAVKYLVRVATDPSLGSLVWTGSAKETQASSFTPLLQLAPGQTYYWGVTPVDAEGNHGAASAVWSFTWRWNSATTTSR